MNFPLSSPREKPSRRLYGANSERQQKRLPGNTWGREALGGTTGIQAGEHS